VLLAHHGEPRWSHRRLWAINGAGSVAGGIVAVLALRVAGSTDALFLAAGLYLDGGGDRARCRPDVDAVTLLCE